MDEACPFTHGKDVPLPEGWPPAGDLRWEKLDAHRRADVERQLRVLWLISEAVKRCGEKMRGRELALKWARELQLGARNRQGRICKKDGLTVKTFNRIHGEWEKADRRWASAARFNELCDPPSPPLQSYNLTPEAAHAFFARQGLTLVQWTKRRSFAPESVSRAINGTRSGEMSQRILDALAEDMRREPEGWHRIMQALQAEAAELKTKTSDFERRLADWQRRLPPWM